VVSSPLESALARVGTYLISDGRYNHLGPDAETRIHKLLSNNELDQLLFAVFELSSIPNLQFFGALSNKDGRVAIHNPALAAIASLGLSAHSKSPHAIADNFEYRKTLDDIYAACLCFNDESDKPIRLNTREQLDRWLAVLAPTMYLQEKWHSPLKNLFVRLAAWFTYIPVDNPSCKADSKLAEFVIAEYGVSLSDIGQCALLLWSAWQLKTPLLRSSTFKNIKDWENSCFNKFLAHFARPLSEFTSPWSKLAPATGQLAARIPIILEHPVVLLEDSKRGPTYVACFPRAVFNHFEDFFYWKCFNHFRDIEKKSSNSFSTWFGGVFEQYGLNLLKGVGKHHTIHDLRAWQQLKIPGPDAAEILSDSITFFEFKIRRMRRETLLSWTEQSIEDALSLAKLFVTQIVNFAKHYSRNKSVHPLRDQLGHAKKKVTFVCITPIIIPINGYVKTKGWFDAEMHEVQKFLGLKCLPEIAFGGIRDLEVLHRRSKTGTFIGNIWRSYIKSDLCPYETFYDWNLRKNRRFATNATNPYLSEVLDRAMGDIEKLFATEVNS
jgi:hypothetical protein